MSALLWTSALFGLVAITAIWVAAGRLARLIRSHERLRATAHRSSRLLRATLDASSDGILVLTGDGRVAACNDRLLELWRVPEHLRAERNGRQLVTFFADQLCEPAALDVERELGPWPADERVDLLELRDGRTFERHAKTQARTGRVWSIRDVTARRRAEATLLAREDQLRQSQKLEAIGQLTTGIAHDFNNLLTAISGYSAVLAAQLDGSPLRHDVGEIAKAAERAAALTRQLLAFSRRQTVQPSTLDLNGVVAELEELLRRLIGEDIELVMVLAPGLASVTADAGQVEQVIVNLAVNARDAMPRGGRLTIETSSVDLPDDESGMSGRCVALWVADSGTGLSEEARSRLFEPFFTTKERGKGTGLGLANVSSIVEQCGGRIQVESPPGGGTTFRILLPAAARTLPVRPATRRSDTSAGTETVLLVEDEATVRHLIRRLLEGAAYTVLEARDGKEALEVAAAHAGTIDLLLTDVVMPHMSGPELAAELAASRPGRHVLYMSGYTAEKLDPQGVLQPHVQFIPKPFTPGSLAHKLREVLEAGPGGPTTGARLRRVS